MISSLGGDVNQAAEVANMAMIDMGDNANKMGTNLTDIQNAYQGFAKQNYTMLDNLKLIRKSIAEYKPNENGENLMLVAGNTVLRRLDRIRGYVGKLEAI